MANRRDYARNLAGHCYYTASNGTVTFNPTYVKLTSKPCYGSRVATDYARRVKPSGWLPPTNYSLIQIDQQHPYGYVRYTSNNPSKRMSWVGYCYVSMTVAQLKGINGQDVSVPTRDHYNQALMKARNQLKAQTVNLPVAFLERNKVAAQMYGTARTLAGAYSALRKGRWKECAERLGISNAKKASGTVANQWLAYQYGWKPLLQDIHGAVLALEGRDSSDWIVTVKGSSQETIQKNGSYDVPGSDPWNWTYYHKGFHGAFCRIDAVPGNSAVATAASLGLTNPAHVAWELVPLSFVVDWFIPIGDYINQFDSLAGWDVKGFSISTLKRIDMRWTGKDVNKNDGYNTYHENRWKAFYSEVNLQRTASLTVPFPVFPRLRNGLAGSRVASALALLRQTFK